MVDHHMIIIYPDLPYLVGGLEHILGMSLSQLTFIFFRGVGIPPTRLLLNIILTLINSTLTTMVGQPPTIGWWPGESHRMLRFHQVEEEIDYEQRRVRHMETDAGPCRAPPPPTADLTRAPNAINLPTMGIGYVFFSIYIYIYLFLYLYYIYMDASLKMLNEPLYSKTNMNPYPA
jgi:hypothetical protein